MERIKTDRFNVINKLVISLNLWYKNYKNKERKKEDSVECIKPHESIIIPCKFFVKKIKFIRMNI